MGLILKTKFLNIEAEESGIISIYDNIVEMEWNENKDFLPVNVLLEDGTSIIPSSFKLVEIPNAIIMEAVFDEDPSIQLRMNLRVISPGDRFDVIINMNKDFPFKEVEFFKNAFPVEENTGGSILIPHGLGKILSVDREFDENRFSCSDSLSMGMYGIINDASALLAIFDDPSMCLSIYKKNRVLYSSFITSKIPQRVQFRLFPEGDLISLILGYREYVKRKNYIVPWGQKLKEREDIKNILSAPVFELCEDKDDIILEFIGHIKRDVGLSLSSFLDQTEDPDEHFNELMKIIRESGYFLLINKDLEIQSDDHVVKMEFYKSYSGGITGSSNRKDGIYPYIKGAYELNERFLPFLDFYLIRGQVFPYPSFYPVFEIAYGDTSKIITKIDNIDEIDLAFLTSLLFGRGLFFSKEILPRDAYWKEEDLRRGKDLPIFMMGENGWGMNMHPFDILIKNLNEIFIPFMSLIQGKRIERFEEIDDKGKVYYTRFENDVEVLINYSPGLYEYFSVSYGKVFLPFKGFIVSSNKFLSFYAYGINGYKNNRPSLFSIRSLDGNDFKSTKKIKVYHAFGPEQFKFMRKIINVEEEKVFFTRS